MSRRRRDMNNPLDCWVESNPLRKWRKKNKKSLEYIADRLNISKQLLYNWESGKYIPPPEYFKPIEDITEVTYEQWANWRTTFPKINIDKNEKCRSS